MSSVPAWQLVYADPSAAVFLDARLARQLKLPKASLDPLKRPPN